ncbi:MAG TPA: ABC transporter permease, partial [Thalassospira sp.]|nr:ABC transporter permease [Thalassospira sp.]
FAYFDSPHAAAMTILVLLALGLVAVAQFRLVEKRTHYR